MVMGTCSGIALTLYSYISERFLSFLRLLVVTRRFWPWCLLWLSACE